MASDKRMRVGVEIDGSAKGYRAAALEAAKSTVRLENQLKTTGRNVAGVFKGLVVALAGREILRSLISFSEQSMKLAIDAQRARDAVAGIGSSETVARFDALTQSFKDLKIAWGDFLINNEALSKAVTGTTLTLHKLTDPRLSLFSKMMMSGADYMKFTAEKAKDFKGTLDGLSPVVKTVAESEESIFKAAYKLTLELQKQHKLWQQQVEDSMLVRGKNVNISPIKGITTGKFASITAPGLAPMGQHVEHSAQMGLDYMNNQLETAARLTEDLTKSFEGFFQNMGEGFDNMAKSFIAAIEQMAAEMAARAALFLILSVITGKGGGLGILSDLFKNLGTFGEFVTTGKTKPIAGISSHSVNVSGKLIGNGKDLFAVFENRSIVVYNNT
jgi:hypothetical protein